MAETSLSISVPALRTASRASAPWSNSRQQGSKSWHGRRSQPNQAALVISRHPTVAADWFLRMATHGHNIPGAGDLFPLSSENHLSAIRVIRALKFSDFPRNEPRNRAEYLGERPEMSFS